MQRATDKLMSSKSYTSHATECGSGPSLGIRNAKTKLSGWDFLWSTQTKTTSYLDELDSTSDSETLTHAHVYQSHTE